MLTQRSTRDGLMPAASACDRAGRVPRPARLPSEGPTDRAGRPNSNLGEVVERERRTEDLAAVAREQAHYLVHRRQDRICRGLGARDRNAVADEELFDPCGAGGDEHARALRADDVGVSDLAGAEEEVACREVDALVADLDCDLALEDVERLVLVVMEVEGRPAAARVIGLDLRERVAGLGAVDLDGDAAALPPDVGGALSGRDAI